MTPTWPCEASGPDGLVFGAWCFLADQHERRCGSQDECATVMAAERRRVFRRIQELAADGSEAGEVLESEFTSPDQLLGGPDPRSA